MGNKKLPPSAEEQQITVDLLSPSSIRYEFHDMSPAFAETAQEVERQRTRQAEERTKQDAQRTDRAREESGRFRLVVLFCVGAAGLMHFDHAIATMLVILAGVVGGAPALLSIVDRLKNTKELASPKPGNELAPPKD